MKPNIMFIILDSLRADMVIGKTKSSIIPNINSLIEKGVYFENTIGSADSTLLAITSIFTGKHPFKTGIRSGRFNKLSGDVKTFFKILQEDSYHLYAHRPTVTKTIGLMPNFENNDSTYDYHFDLNDGLGEKIIKNLNSGMKEPWFYYIHADDLHFPVSPPAEFNHPKYGISKYERMVSAIDTWIGKIVNCLDFNKTLLVITSDHGVFIQSIKTEHGIINFEPHAEKQKLITKMSSKLPKFLYSLKQKVFFELEDSRKKKIMKKIERMNLKPHEKRSLLWQRGDLDKVLYDENVHVPLLFISRRINVNQRIVDMVRSIDIFPTILDIIGIKHNNEIDGRSLVPLIREEHLEELPAYMETTPLIQKKANEVIGIRTSTYKYFRDKDDSKKRAHLFDLEIDPHEEINIANQEHDIVAIMEKLLAEIRPKQDLKQETTQDFSEEETKMIEEELKKLGYD